MKILCLLFAICSLGISKCKDEEAPILANCIHLPSGGMGCKDERREEDDQVYRLTIEESMGYRCTNPDDFGLGMSYIEKLQERLLECESRR